MSAERLRLINAARFLRGHAGRLQTLAEPNTYDPSWREIQQIAQQLVGQAEEHEDAVRIMARIGSVRDGPNENNDRRRQRAGDDRR